MRARQRHVAVAAVVVAMIAAPRVALAYRPFDQTDGDTAEFNTIELEIGPVRFLRGNSTTVFEPGGVFNYGFSPGWELVVDIDGYLPFAPGRELTYTDVMVKHLLRAGVLQEQAGPSIALELGPLLPTLPSFLDEAGWSTALIVSERWHAITAHVNLQVEYLRDRQLEYTAGSIVEGPTAWTVRPVSEAYVERSQGVDLESVLAGAIYRYRDSINFDAAVRVVRSEGITSGEVRVGLTWVLSTT